MKKRKKKKRSITHSVFILIVVTAVITTIISEITGGLISSAWRYGKNLIRPAELQVSLTEFMIYRASVDDFPTCEMDLVVNNPSGQSISVELKDLRLFRDNILHQFSAGQQVIKTGPKDLSVKHVQFRDQVLDQALKVPQDSGTAMIKLIYEYVDRDSRDSLVLGNDDVIKCTYWQVPVFNSEQEALEIGARVLAVDKTIYWTDTLSGESGTTRLTKRVFTDRQGWLDFDGKKPGEISWNLEVHLSDSSAFHRRYGGIYLGCLVSDPRPAETFRYAHEVLGEAGDYYQYTLIGTTYERDFSKIMEFIHYSFDPVKQNEAFRLYQEKSEFYILLTYEHDHGVAEIIDSLRRQGYRAGGASTDGFVEFLRHLTLVTPVERLPSLVEELNMLLDSLNSVINNDGFFLFFPLVLESKRSIRIMNDFQHATSKRHSVGLSFDCRPFRRRLIAAPFSTPLLAFFNFSDETMAKTLDSIKIESFVPP